MGDKKKVPTQRLRKNQLYKGRTKSNTDENSTKAEQASNTEARKKKSRTADDKKAPADEDKSTHQNSRNNKALRKGASKVEKKKEDQVSPEAEAAMKDFCEANTFAVLQQECKAVGEVDLAACSKWSQNKERCRGETPCLDATRVVLTTDEGSDFYHASKIQLDKVDRQYILAQAPMADTVEDFWRMIYQEWSTSIVVTCTFYEEGHESSEQFWPMGTGEYKYYGKMFINNKKVDRKDLLTIYTIEVLPDDSANSLITTIIHCATWKSGQIPEISLLILRLRMAYRLASGDTGTQTIVGSEGINRSACYVATDACISRILKGHKTRIVDIVRQLRQQRLHALNNESLYYYIAQNILGYIKAKKIAVDAVTTFNAELSSLATTNKPA